MQLLLAVDKFGSVYVRLKISDKRSWLRTPQAMFGSILPTIKKKTSRCLIQGQTQCGKILKGKFATNFKKQNKHKEEFEDCDKAEKASGANSARTGRSQAPSSQLQQTIESTINPPRYYNTESSSHAAITSHFHWSHHSP